MASSQSSPGIKLSSKRPRLSSNYDKCIKCQTVKKNEKLQNGTESSVNKFIQYAKQRNDDISRRISPDLKNNTFLIQNVKWHKSCYSTYTSNENVKYNASTHDAMVLQPSTSVTLRSSVMATNWKLCMVCQQVKCKGERDLTHVANLQVYDTLMNAAQCRNDKTMMMRIRGEDLVAMEAKYHRGCYRRYTAAASSSKSKEGDKSIQVEYDSAFLKLINEIEQKLVKEGRAYDMATLLCMYKRHLTDSGMEKAVTDMYKVQNLKRKLIQHYGEKIKFHQQYERNKSELVCSSSLNLAEIINLVAELTEATKDS